MKINIKDFQNLSISELYHILQLRSEVFVVEQECVYQDIDGKDPKAQHVLGYDQGKLLAYTRIFPPGTYFPEASIGRVVVNSAYRGNSFGHRILEASILAIQDHFGSDRIRISAQVYLIHFYELHGFLPIGEEYLEDGIPHISMIKN